MSATPSMHTSTNLEAGSRLGKYVILSEIGRGGMAVVYKAHQPELDRVVAVKVLFGSMLQQRFIERFQNEARALAKMNHPNVIHIFEVGEQDGAYYLVMEYIQGLDLLGFLHEKKPSFEEVLEIVHQIAEAMAYTHKQGVLHRDLKPINILMRDKAPVLIDFGLAKALDPVFDQTLTLSGEVIGSPAYMSPEQAQGLDVGALSDVCSLGIIMYELIAFKNPYLDPRSLHQTALNSINADPVPLRYLAPWLDADFAAIVQKCMAKETADRYQDMDQLLKDLHAYRLGQPLMAKPPGILQLAWRFIKANPVLYWGAAFFLVISAVVGGFLSLQNENKIAPLGLVLEELFARPDSVTPYVSLDKTPSGWKRSASWNVVGGRLEGNCSGLCAAVLDQDFFGDIKVEFTVQGLEGNSGDFNAFLFGSNPDEGFRFTLGEWGTERANIEYGAAARYPNGGVPVRLNGGIPYVVTLEKDGNALRLWVDGRLLVEKFYPLPVNIEHGSSVGFYTWNGKLAVDGIRIYKKAVAMAASPTVVADAYLEEGFIRNSIPAYKFVIEAYRRKAVSLEARLKLGKCFMVLRDYTQAIPYLNEAAGGSKNPEVVAEALFQLAQCYFLTGKTAEGYTRLKLLPATFPESEFNQAVVRNRVEAIYTCLNREAKPETCTPVLNEEFRFLIENEDPFRSRFGRAQAEMFELFRRLGVTTQLNNAAALFEYYSGAEEAGAALRQSLVRFHVGEGDFGTALKLLKQTYTGSDRKLLAEQEILNTSIDFLQIRYDKSGTAFTQAAHTYKDVPGIPFRCLILARVSNILAGRPGPYVDNSWFVNDAIPRRERLYLAFIAGRMEESLFRQTMLAIPPGPPLMEEVLAEYLRLIKINPGPQVDALLLNALTRFPAKSFEAAYLGFLIGKSEQPVAQ